MELLLSTGSAYSELSLQNIFVASAQAGFDGLEYVMSRKSGRRQLDQLHDLVAKTGLPVRNIHSPFDELSSWGGPIGALHETVALARSIGSRCITFHPPERVMGDVEFARWISQIDDFQIEVGGGDVLVTMENMPKKRAWRGIKVPFTTSPYRFQERDEMWELMESRNLYMTFDTTHFGASGESLGACFSLFRDRIKVIHLSNFRSEDFQEHLPVDRGDLDLEEFVRRVVRMGYDETITFEVLPKFLVEHQEGISGALSQYIWWMTGIIGRRSGAKRTDGTGGGRDGNQTDGRRASLPW